jgi:hypothetical protein
MPKLILGSACLLTALVLTFTAINADYHNAKCVPAKQKMDVTSDCRPGSQLGLCEGGVSYQDIVVDGFCDSRENGNCYDATASFSIYTGTFSASCVWVPGGCVPPTNVSFPDNAPKQSVVVQSCSSSLQ